MTRFICLLASVAVFAHAGAQAQQSEGDAGIPAYQKVSGISGSANSIGSDTMNNLMTLWLEGFRKYYPNVKIQVEGKGSSTAPPALIEGFARHGLHVTHAWGMTELNPLGSVANLKRSHGALGADGRLAARARQGHPVPICEFRCVGEDGAIRPWDGESQGELQVRGPSVARSYHGGAGADDFTADGWFRTGDIVAVDEHGSILIADRARDVVKSGGEWISSVALENALMAHPAVAEAAVFAAEDERWGERPLAAVVPAPGASLDPAALRAHLEPRFLRWWLPAAYVEVDEVPRTSTGKFDKAALRARYGRMLADGGA